MTEIEKKTGMTDAECEYWDKHIIENTVIPGPNLLKLGIKPGIAHKALVLNELDDEVVEYLRGHANKQKKSPSQVIKEWHSFGSGFPFRHHTTSLEFPHQDMLPST